MTYGTPLQDNTPTFAAAGWQSQKHARRQEKRAQLQARILAPVTENLKRYDPLTRDTRSFSKASLMMLTMLGFAVLAHVGVLAGFIGVSALWGTEEKANVSAPLRITIQEAAPPPPQPQPVVQTEPEPVQEQAALVEIKPVEPKPVVEARKPPKKKKMRKKRRPLAEPTADPIDTPARAEVPAPKSPPRRVVGLSMESTVTGGGGPAFAVGNSRMGATSATAENPNAVTKLAPSKTGVWSGEGGKSPNRVASIIPRSGVEIRKPTRVGQVRPMFPEMLKARGIEGNVGVRVNIDKMGRVTGVTLVRPSKHGPFNTSALAAARKERFKPATRDGKPIAYNLSYAYRFRIKN